MSKITTRNLVLAALLIALQIVVVKFLSVETTIVRFDFGYIVSFTASAVLGPWLGMLVAFAADILGVVLRGQIGVFFPGFTINAVLYALFYGLFFYKKKITWYNVTICVVSSIALMGILLAPHWVFMYNTMLGTGINPLAEPLRFIAENNHRYITEEAKFDAILYTQLIKHLILIPIQIITMKYIGQYLFPHILRYRNGK